MAYLMIIDDDEDFAAAAATALRNAGHEVAIAQDPTPAIADMEARPPDVLILDVMFPEDASAGFMIARDLRRRDDALRKVPILMLTAVNCAQPLGFGAQDGEGHYIPVSDFLEKPVDLHLLPKRISRLLQSPGGATG